MLPEGEQSYNFTENVLLEERVDQFVERQRQMQQKLASKNRRNNFTLVELARNSSPLPVNIVDSIFDKNITLEVTSEVVDEVRKTLHTMRLRLNSLDPRKRFFILDTMDFFRSKISIGKLIPAILLLKDDDQKKAVLEFVIPTFLSINKNIETLVSTTELFTSQTLHLNRGSLYSFASDLAKILIPLFKPNLLKKYTEIISPVELLLKAINPTKNGKTGSIKDVYSRIIDDEEKTRRILLNFIVAIQSHEALFNYSIKRYGYYKLFLNRLTFENRFEDFQPIIISKILAGCLLSNSQMKPDEKLIDAMVHREKFAVSATIKAKKSFIDKLAPSTIFSIINQFKIHLQTLSRIKLDNEFDEIQELSVKSILKKVWTGFTKLADGGLSIITAPLETIFNQIKETITHFIEEEKDKEKEIQESINKPFTPLIPKRPESLAYLKKHYSIVQPNIVGFRGEDEGATQKDYAYNARFFKKGEITLLEFNYCFKRLLESLQRNKNVKVIVNKKQKKMIEYHAAFLYSNYLICIGTTHLKSDNPELIEEKDVFPYVIFFTEAMEKKKGRLPAREVKIKGQTLYFNETVMIRDNALGFYKSILYILHLLPDEDWNSSASQSCIKFVIKELRRLSD